MSRQLLRNSRVVIQYNERVYTLSALSQFSANTSLGEVTQRRKTLFSNTTKQHTHTDRINSTTTSLEVYLTDNYIESLFFELVGLDSAYGQRNYLPSSVDTNTKLFSMYIINEDSIMYSENNYVQSVDISLAKASILSLSVDISSANLKRVQFNKLLEAPTAPLNQGNILPPSPLLLKTGDVTWNTIKSATISLQQEADWINNKSLFDIGSPNIYEVTKAATSDIIVSATIQTNYDTESSIFNEAVFQDLLLGTKDFGLIVENARIIHNLDIQPVYGNRLDVSIAEESNDTYFYFGE
ncbi:base plate tail tube protein [Vibrio phage D260]